MYIHIHTYGGVSFQGVLENWEKQNDLPPQPKRESERSLQTKKWGRVFFSIKMLECSFVVAFGAKKFEDVTLNMLVLVFC